MINGKELVGKISDKAKLKAKLNQGIQKAYPHLEDLTVIPDITKQEFNHPNSYGYDKVTVNAVEGSQLNITPSTESQEYIGLYGTVDVNPIPSEYIIPTGTKNITENGITDVTNYANANINIPMPISESDVNFYDYDGTLLYSYTKQEFLALTELPENPTHTGLVAQGWNWTLSDAKEYVTEYGILDIGQVYTTSSGLSEFDISLNAATGLTVTLNLDGTKNWGDGTSDTTTSHTYSTVGKYTITCNGTTMTTSSNGGLFGQTTYVDNINSFVTNIRITGISTISSYAFVNCIALKTVILSNDVTLIDTAAFRACKTLKYITIPKISSSCGGSYAFASCFLLSNISISKSTATILSESTFSSCCSLKRLCLPSSITRLNAYSLNGLYSLEKIIFPLGVANISASYVLENNSAMLIYDFSHLTSVPTLNNINSFSGINKQAKIIVPDDLYTTWTTASKWSTYANYIIKKSDYSAN